MTERLVPASCLVPELSSQYNELRTAIRRDGLELLLSSDRPNGRTGLSDIWVSTRDSTLDPWSTPVNLGRTVNYPGSTTSRPSLSWERSRAVPGSARAPPGPICGRPLVPRRYQSGEVDYAGGISKCGDRRVRTLLYEAANVMLTRYKGQLKLKDWALAIAKRSTMRNARIALARRLATIMHAMLQHGTEFKPA